MQNKNSLLRAHLIFGSPKGAGKDGPAQSESASGAERCEQHAILGVIKPQIDYPEGIKSFSPRLRVAKQSHLGSSNNKFIKAPQISPAIFLLHPIPLESLLHQQGVTMYQGGPHPTKIAVDAPARALVVSSHAS
jgi:hypothetical protein